MFTRRGLVLHISLVTLAIISNVFLSSAKAQDTSSFGSTRELGGWLSDRTQNEGRGIRLGNFELHPGVGAEVGYDTNVFYADKDPKGSAILRLTSHLAISTIGEERKGTDNRQGSPPTIAFRAGLGLGFYHFFIDSARDNLAGDAALNLVILPGRTFSLGLRNRFTRTIRPFAQNFTVQKVNYTRDHNDAGADIFLRTRGNVLEGKLGYTFGVDFFEGAYFKYNTNYQHTINADMTYRFFPHTAFLYRGSFSYRTYPDDNSNPLALVADSTLLSSSFGINGAITPSFSATAMIGYTAGFYENIDDFDGLIGQVEGRYVLTDAVSLAGGFARDYVSSFIGNFVRQDRVYLNSVAMIGGVFMLKPEVSLGYLTTGRTLTPTGGALGNENTREDLIFMASLFGEYRVSDMLGINSTLRYTQDFTDYEYVGGASGTPIIDPAEFQKFEAWLGARFYY